MFALLTVAAAEEAIRTKEAIKSSLQQKQGEGKVLKKGKFKISTSLHWKLALVNGQSKSTYTCRNNSTCILLYLANDIEECRLNCFCHVELILKSS